MYKNAVFIVAQFNFHNAEVWFWWHWVLKGFTFANVLWREPIHLLPYFSRSSVSHRFPWLSGTFFTSLQCSTGGRSVKIICKQRNVTLNRKLKLMLCTPVQLKCLILSAVSTRLSMESTTSPRETFGRDGHQPWGDFFPNQDSVCFLVLINSRNSDKTVSTGYLSLAHFLHGGAS